VGTQLAEDSAIVPAASADEQLQGAAYLPALAGDGFGGLTPESAELAAEDGAGVGALFGAGEERQVVGKECYQGVGAGAGRRPTSRRRRRVTARGRGVGAGP
jgi:hypothetical protein